MASGERKVNGQGTKRPRLTYFFLNGDLHKAIEINRGRDLLRAWNFPKGELKAYNYTDTLRYKETAFRTTQVCAMLGRNRITIERAWQDGNIEKPQHAYTLNKERRLIKYFWTEKEILDLLDFLASVHQGRPRKDGRITPASDLPTPRELRAMIRHDANMLGTMENGTFVPTWRAKEK